MYQQNQSIIYPLPTDALLLEREVVWRVKGYSTNPVGEKSPTGFFTCKKEKSRL